MAKGKAASKASATAAAHAASKKKSSVIEISARVEAQIRRALQVGTLRGQATMWPWPMSKLLSACSVSWLHAC